MPKRNATSELNHDNWNDDEEPEDAGTFQKAAPDIIGKRVIKSARRRSLTNHSSGPSVFAGFQGFNKPRESSSPFSFLKKSEAESGRHAPKSAPAAAAKASGASESPSAAPSAATEPAPPPSPAAASTHTNPREPSPPYTDAYLAAVKKLNECFVNHIQTYFKENEFVIFSPCFKDYEKHLKEILCFNAPKTSNVNDTLNSPKSFASQPPNAGKLNIFSSPHSKQNSGSELKTIQEESSGTSPADGLSLNTGGKQQLQWFSKLDEQTSSQHLSNNFGKGEFKVPTTGTTTGTEDPEDESEEPVKVEFKAVVEEGAVYSRRCKVFVKKDNTYQDHGVGMLHLKPLEAGKKTQLIVRADTSLGNVLINTLLNSDMSIQKMGNNNVMLCCVPTPEYKPPKPLPVLLRVKTSDDADELLKKMNKFTK